MKNAVIWDLRRVALVRTDISEELSSSIIRVTRIGELGATLVVTSNQRTLRRNMMAALSTYETSVLTRAIPCNIPEDGILQFFNSAPHRGAGDKLHTFIISVLGDERSALCRGEGPWYTLD
jgi:hypothetical protein